MDPTLLLLFGGFIAFMYMFTIRPQQQQQKRMKELFASLATGDRVVTIGGFYGTIEAVDDNSVDLRIAQDVIVTFEKTAIGKRIEDEADAS